MTCIIGYKDKGKVYIGGDSLGSNGSQKTPISNPKVFKKGPFIIGYTSTFRHGQIMQFHLKVAKKKSGTNFKYMVTEFAEGLRKCFKEHGINERDKEVDSGVSCLVAFNGELFEIQSDYSVLQSTRNYMAVGCGTYYAMGALAILDHAALTPLEKIDQALNAVAFHDPSVGGPFHVMCI